MPKITINTTDGSSLEFELTADRYRIGRAQDNDLVVPDGSVSSYHGEIFVQGDSIEFHDLGSTNGTHVNGQRVEKASVGPGQDFRIGSCAVFLAGAAAEEEEAPASEDDSPYEAPEPDFSSAGSGGWASSGPTNSAAAITGLGATPCPTHLRQGFGPKTKKKTAGGGLILLGVLGIAACAAGAFMILQMGGS